MKSLPIDGHSVRLIQNDLRSDVIRSAAERSRLSAARQSLLTHSEISFAGMQKSIFSFTSHISASGDLPIFTWPSASTRTLSSFRSR